MHCSACAARIEHALGRVPGLASASVNLATARAFVSYNGSAISAGESARPSSTSADSQGGRCRRRIRSPSAQRPVGAACDHLLALAIAALLVSLLLPQTAGPGWTVLVLAVVVEFAGGWPFLRNAARLLRHGAVSMDTLIAFGTLAAVAVQAGEVIAVGGRHIHVDSGGGAFAGRLHYAMAPLILAVLVSGRRQGRRRRHAVSAMHSLLSLRPPMARVVTDPDSERGDLVAPESVPVGALVRMPPNEAIPLDGSVVRARK